MASKFCQYCGSPMEDNSNFCQSCGKSQTSSASSSTPSSSYSSPASTYSPPPSNYNSYTTYNQMSSAKDRPLTVGNYIGMFFLCAIPLVNVILLLVWAFGSDANTNKKNYARAILILGLIGAGLSILLGFVIAPLLSGLFSNFSGMMSGL